MKKYLIVGGVAGGATTAARLRRQDENSQIVVFEKGDYVSYANCGLPYYIGNIITERDKLFVQTPEGFKSRFNVDVRIKSDVIEINRDKKCISVKNLLTGEVYQETYDKLILSPGAVPMRPLIPGIESEGVFSLRSVPDSDAIHDYLEKKQPHSAVIIGAGFIGLEMAEGLRHKGLNVTIVEMADQVLNVLDFEMAAEVHHHLKSKNISLYLKESVQAIKQIGEELHIALSDGSSIKAGLVILSLGIKPDSRLAIQSQLKLGSFGGIEVNEYLQTSDPDIYAVGDAIEFVHPILKQSMPTYLAGPANKQGRIAADNIVAGNHKKYHGAIGTAIAKVFDLTAGCTGASEKMLKKYNIRYIASVIHGSSHAGYYPDAATLSIKLLFSEAGQLLGAQVVGYEGIDKRLDVLSEVIRRKGSIYELGEFEHAYAPPYSSAKDPVNIAGFVAENILSGSMKVVYWNEIDSLKGKDSYFLDVRTPEEFSLGTIPGSINIAIDNLRDKMDDLPKNKTIVVFCAVGLRGYLACRILQQNGFDKVFNLSGGYKTYSKATAKQSFIAQNKEFIAKDDVIYQIRPHLPSTNTKLPELKIVDACGMQCPGPIIKLKNEIDQLPEGSAIQISATDMGFANDVESWCRMTGNRLISLSTEDKKVVAVISKEARERKSLTTVSDDKTLIVFSDDLDRALASFVIANGAVSMGRKVTMFFTFWGLNVVKKSTKPVIKKDFISRLIGMFIPSSSLFLGVSKLNMFGLGSILMRLRMKNKKVDSLEAMIQTALQNGVHMIACQMSMDVMGIAKEELLDSIHIGGVATYLDAAEKSNLNLFI